MDAGADREWLRRAGIKCMPQLTRAQRAEIKLMYLRAVPSVLLLGIIFLWAVQPGKELFRCLAEAGALEGRVRHAEFFAGIASHTRALRSRYFSSIPYEINMQEFCMDFLYDDGFALAIRISLAIKWGGATTWAPVCSSWFWL